jgi:hypothetical protein
MCNSARPLTTSQEPSWIEPGEQEIREVLIPTPRPAQFLSRPVHIVVEKYVAVSSTETQNACGAESSGQSGNALVKLAVMKHEPDSEARERFA